MYTFVYTHHRVYIGGAGGGVGGWEVGDLNDAGAEVKGLADLRVDHQV